MPEGPEVTRLVTQLNTLVLSERYTIKDIKILSGRYLKKSIEGLEDFLIDVDDNLINDYRKVSIACLGIKNKGKFIYWKFGSDSLSQDWYLFNSLGMTGGWRNLEDKHSRVVLEFTNNKKLYFSDQRSFGTLKFIKGDKELDKKLSEIGPDMLNNPCSLEEFLEICEKHKHKSIVKFLLEQKAISGIGNIYKSESLYLAKINPRHKLSEISLAKKSDLYYSVLKVLKNAYELGGSTIRDYKDLYGKSGRYVDTTKYNHATGDIEDMQGVMIYNQKIDPLGNKVEKIKLDDDRTTFWVPSIQT